MRLAGDTQKKAEQALEKAVTGDHFALVREAALMAIAKRGGAFAKRVLSQVAKRETEPRLKRLAIELGK